MFPTRSIKETVFNNTYLENRRTVGILRPETGWMRLTGSSQLAKRRLYCEKNLKTCLPCPRQVINLTRRTRNADSCVEQDHTLLLARIVLAIRQLPGPLTFKYLKRSSSSWRPPTRGTSPPHGRIRYDAAETPMTEFVCVENNNILHARNETSTSLNHERIIYYLASYTAPATPGKTR